MSPLAAVAVAAGVVALAAALGWWLRARDGRRRAGGGLQVRAADIAPGGFGARATLVQFSTQTCARCPQVRRMLSAVAARHDDVVHAEVDLTHRPEVAARYRVLQTPTTFLVDADGTVVSRWSGVPEPAAVAESLALFDLAQEHR